jgi:predicted enzyme related to lactoylglutathione lyase
MAARKQKQRHPSFIQLTVASVPRAIRFYEERLGFQLAERHPACPVQVLPGVTSVAAAAAAGAWPLAGLSSSQRRRPVQPTRRRLSGR